MIDMYLYDDDESSQVQFVGFVGEYSRYDLMLIQTDRHFGKTMVLNMQTNKFGIIPDIVNSSDFIDHVKPDINKTVLPPFNDKKKK